jgi:hypothetical protein
LRVRERYDARTVHTALECVGEFYGRPQGPRRCRVGERLVDNQMVS